MTIRTATAKTALIYTSFFAMVLIAVAGTVFLTYRAYRFQKIYDAEMVKEAAMKKSAP